MPSLGHFGPRLLIFSQQTGRHHLLYIEELVESVRFGGPLATRYSSISESRNIHLLLLLFL